MSSIDVFLDPRTCQDLCANFNSSNHTLKQSVAGNIMSAMSTGARSATTAIGSASGADVHNILHMLNQVGYNASLSGTNILVKW